MQDFMNNFNIFLNFFLSGLNLIYNWFISTIIGQITLFIIIISLFIYLIVKLLGQDN